MLIFPMGTGTGILPILFLMFFVVPMVMRVLASFAGATHSLPHDGAPATQPMRGLPAYDPQAAFAAAKADFPGQLIDFDTKLGEAEDFGSNLNAAELKAAREHLNKAFAAYAQHFAGDAPEAIDVAAAVKQVESNLKAAQRHLLLADPNTAAEVAEMDAKLKEAEVEAGRAAAARAKMQAEAAAANEALGFNAYGRGYARPVARRTTVQVTPFGIMIGSF